MLLSNDVNPDLDLYNIGAVLLEKIHENNNVDIDIIDLYGIVRARNRVSLSLFLLALDWLFLLDCIERAEHGRIRKCS